MILNCELLVFGVFFPQLNLQESLKTAEEQLASKKDTDYGPSESMEDLKVALETREKALRSCEEERDTLMSELEELDRQNQEATQVRLTSAASLSLFYSFVSMD